MIPGVQTHFSASVDPTVLREVRRLGFQMARMDLQGVEVARIPALLAEVRGAGLEPLPIVDSVEQIRCVLPGGRALWRNECDPGGVGLQVEPRLYAVTLEAACRAAWDCGADLWAPELSNLDEDSFRWLNAVREAGRGWPKGLAGISVHRYPPGRDFTQQHSGFAARERELVWLRAACCELPFAVTEFGWPSFGLTEDEQADRIRQEWAFWEREGAQFAILYQLNDGLGVFEHYGIRRVDGAWKPSAFTLTAVSPEPAPVPTPPPTGGVTMAYALSPQPAPGFGAPFVRVTQVGQTLVFCDGPEATRVVSCQPDGSLESRDPGACGAYEVCRITGTLVSFFPGVPWVFSLVPLPE